MSFIFLAEKAHPVLQGEGNLIGKKMIVCRVKGCNLKCINCDSAYTWQSQGKSSNKEEFKYSVKDLSKVINIMTEEYKTEYIMITGGAPSLYQNELFDLINGNQHLKFQIEDAGDKNWAMFNHFTNLFFSFSPKIGALENQTTVKSWKAFENIHRNFICKVVVSEDTLEQDLLRIEKFKSKYYIPNNRIYLMPFGTTREEIIKQSSILLDAAFENGYNFSPRLHVLLFDNKRLV